MPGQYSLSDLSGQLGGDLYNTLFSSQGFQGGSGDLGNPWAEQQGWNESGDPSWSMTPNDSAYNAFQDYSFNWTPTGGQGGVLDAYGPKGQPYGTYNQKDEDWFTKAMGTVAPAIASWGFGGALSPLFGGGALGGALGHGLSSGAMSSMQGGSFGQGFLSGGVAGGLQGMAAGTPASMGNNPSAYVPAQSGTSFAGMSGISNPTLANMFNRGVGSTLGGLASGKSGAESLKSGLLGAGLSGANSLGTQGMDFISNAFKTLMPSGDDGFDSLMGSGGDMSGQTDVTPSSYEDTSPSYRYAGDQSPNMGFMSGFGQAPQQQIQQGSEGFFPSILGDIGSRIGSYATNNMGDLASMLYGFYNSRKQQKALGDQLAGLRGLYSNNSPYATQLKNQIDAKAAAGGRRSNIGGRATQLQAMLADKAASTMPTQYQIQQGQNQLKNSNMNMLLQGFNKMGGFNAVGQGLQGMFRPQASLTGLGSFDAYKNLDDMYGTVG